jgi:long-chain acyl-CoA synthetase
MTDEPAVACGARSRSWSQLRARAARIAGGLATLGVGAGDRVAVVLRNELEFVEVTVGAGLLGAVPVPVNWHWREEEVGYLLADSGSRVAFVHSDLVPVLEAARPDGVPLIEVAPTPALATAFGLAGDALRPTGRHAELDSWLAAQPAWEGPPVLAPMGMIYTSGTTGVPKGIVRAQQDEEQRGRLTALVFEAFGLNPALRTLIPAPLYHSAPNVHMTVSAAAGIDLTLMPRFDPEEFCRLVQQRRIQHAQMVPTMFVRLLALPERVRAGYDMSSLVAVVHAAAPCPPALKQGMIDWLGPIIQEYYGSSETGIVVACDSAQALAHPGTVGRACQDGDVHILDAAGAVLPPGQVGGVYLRTPSCWPDFSYHGAAEKRRAMERDGYVTVGDVGYLDAEGYLYLTDRAIDMVISGGVNIYPAEIEACLSGLPGVRDVAVFGIPDAEYGEALAAHVDADPQAGLTEQDVRGHVRARLAGYKVPKVVVFDHHLPREDSGKLFKRRLRERYLS